jgi:hypothetical protein
MFARALQNAIAPAKPRVGPMSWAEAILLSVMAFMAVPPVVATLYVAKSALGINLMDGPSPLHDLLYRFVA